MRWWMPRQAVWIISHVTGQHVQHVCAVAPATVPESMSSVLTKVRGWQLVQAPRQALFAYVHPSRRCLVPDFGLAYADRLSLC